MKVRPLYLLIIILLFAFSFARIYPKLIYSAQRKAFHMGTTVRIKVKGPNAPQLAGFAIDEIKRLDKLFSKFNPESDVYKLNSSTERENVQLSSDTRKILKEAVEFSKLTKGAFDITLGHPEGQIDLGAIAKGYAVESVRSLLLKRGAKSGMIDMHSSIAVFGPRTWRVGIQNPREKEKLMGTIELKGGQSLATSGDYERGEHIIDPRTGKPAKLCQSVTIVGKNATETDALATAVFVLGPEKGTELIESLEGVEGLIIGSKGQIFKSSGLTSNFKPPTSK